MKLAILNYCGTVGKTTIAANFLAPRMQEAPIFAIETINETAADLGLDIEKIKGDQFGHLFKELMKTNHAIIDIGASNIENFLDRMIKYEDSHTEIDLFIIPVTPGAKEQKETIKTIRSLSAAGIPAAKIQVIFNRVESVVEEEFDVILGFAKISQLFIANPKVAIFENELFNLLSDKKLTMGAVMQDTNDYKALLKESLQNDNQKIGYYSDMIAIKALTKGATKRLDEIFTIMFEETTA